MRSSHKRLENHSISSFDMRATEARVRPTALGSARYLTETDSINIGNGNGPSISASGSDSKIWGKKRRYVNGGDSAASIYGHAFKVIFVVCLLLFLHALLGIGGRLPSERDADSDQMLPKQEIRSRYSGSDERHARHRFADMEHNHLAIDPDGHYSQSVPFAYREDTRRWKWVRNGRNYTRVRMIAMSVRSTNAEDVASVPTETIDKMRYSSNLIEQREPPVVHMTPPPVSLPEYTHAAILSQEPLKNGHDFDDAEMDLPWLDLDGQAYPMRIHLPETKSPASAVQEHRRGRRGRTGMHGRIQ